MKFDFNEDQHSLRKDARRFLADRCAMEMVRAQLEADPFTASPLWQEMADMGWQGVSIPEAYGGLGMGYLELCVLAEELGRVAAPVPYSSSIYLAAEAILRYGSESQKQQYLPGLASGELIGTLAWSTASAGGAGEEQGLVYRDGELSGRLRSLVQGTLAHIAVVRATTLDGEAVLTLVKLDDDTEAGSLSRQSLNSVDPSQRYAEVDFHQYPAELLGDCPDVDAVLANLLDRAAVLIAFEQVGGAQRCQELAVDYVQQRTTFSRTVGSYQAVKHKLALMYARNELARSNAYYGAWALAADSEELPIAAAAARVSATECYEFAAREGLHLHGGMGYTWEVDCHLYLKRSRDLAVRLGSARRWKEKLLSSTLVAMQDPATTPTWLANA